MPENSESEITSSERRIEWIVRDLQKISRTMQAIGFFVVVASFISAVASVVVFSYYVRLRGPVELGDYMWMRELVFILAGFSASLAISAIFAVLLRDTYLRRGKIIADVLVEESERTSIGDGIGSSVSVRIAIRSFFHLRALPLVGESSSGLFYVVLSLGSLLTSLFVFVSMQ